MRWSILSLDSDKSKICHHFSDWCRWSRGYLTWWNSFRNGWDTKGVNGWRSELVIDSKQLAHWILGVSCYIYILHTTISGLRQGRDFFSQDVLKTVYSSLIQPVFDHCNAVWSNMNKGLASKIQKLQNRSAYIITSQGYETKSVDLLKFIVWDNLAMRRDQRFCLLTHNVIIKNVPEYLSEFFPMSCESNPHKSCLVCTYMQNCSVNPVSCLV